MPRKRGKMDIIETLARNVLETGYEDLPGEVVRITKLAILDTIGCIMAGSTAPGCDLVRKQVINWGGRGESTIMVFGDKVPCSNAAFVNSTMARALDFDTTWPRGVHMNAASVPTALAVAEMCQGISGKEFLAAIVAGEDLAARIRSASSGREGFEPTGVCGILGLAAITGKILGLGERQMLDALAIAFNRAAGSVQPNIDGALIVRVMEGLASRSGIESALLAQIGISGGENTLQGAYGYFYLFSDGKYDAEILTNKLGEVFVGALQTQFKEYPACGGSAPAIEATLQLVRENDVRAEEVDQVTVHSKRFFHNLLGNPFKIGANPQGAAQFSYQYAVANALVRKRFGIEDIAPLAISSPEVIRFVSKVQPRLDENLTKESLGAAVIDIKTKQGKLYSRQVDYRRGSKQRPIDREEIINKFRYCGGFAESPSLRGNIERIIGAVDELEQIGNINELIHLITQKAS